MKDGEGGAREVTVDESDANDNNSKQWCSHGGECGVVMVVNVAVKHDGEMVGTVMLVFGR